LSTTEHGRGRPGSQQGGGPSKAAATLFPSFGPMAACGSARSALRSADGTRRRAIAKAGADLPAA
jgi:hypothetical protein